MKKAEPCVIRIDNTEYALSDAQRLFGIEDGTICENPEFTDYENCKFTLQKNSSAAKIHFRPIDPDFAGAKRV